MKNHRRNRSRLRLVAAATGAVALAFAIAVSGCHSPNLRSEEGAVLLTIVAPADAPTPDELRVSVFDDSGPLWKNVRVPESGPLVPEGPHGELGSLLIQPGSSRGALRVHARGLSGGKRIVDGTLKIARGELGRAPIELRLSAQEPRDEDGDDVPDDVDNCPGKMNPDQGGCAVAPPRADAASDDSRGGGRRDDAGQPTDAAGPGGAMDGGAGGLAGHAGMPDARADAGSGAGGSRGGDAGAGGGTAGHAGAAGAATGGQGGQSDGLPRSLGAACGASSQCESGSCTDGVCCERGCDLCETCAMPGAVGRCRARQRLTEIINVPAAQSCSGVFACDGAGSCRKKTGSACKSASECISGSCVDGVCCNSECTGACRTCATGTCEPIVNAKDPPSCSGARTCDAVGRCVVR